MFQLHFVWSSLLFEGHSLSGIDEMGCPRDKWRRQHQPHVPPPHDLSLRTLVPMTGLVLLHSHVEACLHFEQVCAQVVWVLLRGYSVHTSCCSVVTSKSSLVPTKTKQCQSFRNKLVMSLPEVRSDFDEENVAAVLEAISSHRAHGSSCARTICLFNLSVVEVNFLSKLKMGYTYTQYSNA